MFCTSFIIRDGFPDFKSLFIFFTDCIGFIHFFASLWLLRSNHFTQIVSSWIVSVFNSVALQQQQHCWTILDRSGFSEQTFMKLVGINSQGTETYNSTTGKQKEGKPNLIYDVLWSCISVWKAQLLMCSMFTHSYSIITHWHVDQIVRYSVGFGEVSNYSVAVFSFCVKSNLNLLHLFGAILFLP